MLENAIVAYLDGLGERELDVPLRALLRAEGFHDIELVHGVSEFGRDFLAKHPGQDGQLRQFSVQSKVGDIGIGEWREVRDQLEDIRTVPIAHPVYDKDLPGTIMLVTTGRLKGDARAAANAYRDGLAAPWEFEIWTRERLTALILTHLQAALGDRAEGPLLRMLGAVDEGTIELVALERHTRKWIPPAGATIAAGDVLEAGLLASRLQRAGRLDLACYAALGVLRAQVASTADTIPIPGPVAAEITAAGDLFAMYAKALWDACDESTLSANGMIATHQEFGLWVTYPVRCTRLAELLALYGLWREARGEEPAEIIDWLTRFLEAQPGCAHPVSDRHAVSLLPVGILLAERTELLSEWLREAARWTADRHEGESIGLASVDASPEQEVEYLLGDLEHITLPRRRESLIAAVLLDLASLLELGAVYDDVRNEMRAVETVADLRHPPAGRDAWLRDGEGVRQELNPPYAERFADAEGWQTAPHHHNEPSWPAAAGLRWEALAIWMLLRDRYEAPVLRGLLGTPHQPESETSHDVA